MSSTAQAINYKKTIINHTVLADALNDKTLKVGAKVQIEERVQGQGGGGLLVVGDSFVANNESIIDHNFNALQLKIIADGVVDVARLGIVLTTDSPTIDELIAKSNEILNVINNYHAIYGATVFSVPYSMGYDGKTLFTGIPKGSSLEFTSHDSGYSYTGYITKSRIGVNSSTQDEDMAYRFTDGHHPVLMIHNMQLPNTGIKGLGQSLSSSEGKCSVVFQQGWREHSGRMVPGRSSRLQRWHDGTSYHFAFQHPREIGDLSTTTMFDFTSAGNMGVGDTSKPEYNLYVGPDNQFTPAADKRTTIALRNVQPSGKGCRVEFVGRGASGTHASSINYNEGVLSFLPDDSLQGGYTGKLEDVLFNSDVTIGKGRNTPSGNNAAIKPVVAENKGVISAINTLVSGLTASQIFIETKSETKGFKYLRLRNNVGSDVCSIDGDGGVSASSFTPFTGCHFFYSDKALVTGYPVDLVEATQILRVVPSSVVDENNSEVDDSYFVTTNGTVAYSGYKSKICAGVVQKVQQLDFGYLIVVAAVGDNKAGELSGFKVNDENGNVIAGDILCTSSINGELMRLSSGEPESIVRFKAMSAPNESNVVYGYF